MGSSGSAGLLPAARIKIGCGASGGPCARRVLKCMGRGQAAGMLPVGAAPLQPLSYSAPAHCLAPGLLAWFFGVFWGCNSCGFVIPFAEGESESTLGLEVGGGSARVSTYVLQSKALKAKVRDFQPNQQGCSKMSQLGPAGVTHVVRAFKGLIPSHWYLTPKRPRCFASLSAPVLAAPPGGSKGHRDVLLDHSWNFIWSRVPVMCL